MRPILLALVAGSALAVALCSCGSSGGSGDGLSKAELAKRANAICTDDTTRLKQQGPPAKNDAAHIAAYLDGTKPLIAATLAKLKALDPKDAAVRKDWQAYVATQTKTADALSTMADQLKASKLTAVRSTLEDISKLAADAKTAANKVGAGDCAGASTG